MSSAPEPVERLVRTVSSPSHGHSDPGMSAIGWMIFVGLLFLLVPLLPIIAAVWLISKVTEFLTGQTRGGL